MQPNFDKRILHIDALLREAGASDFLAVGGCVRDLILGLEPKDLDFEVYGLDYDQICAALKPYFKISCVGQSFSVVKVANEFDLAIPRRESKSGVGHKAFVVEPDSTLTFAQAAARRDFTINAIGMRLNGELCDPYHGVDDIKNGILRATSEAFCEDPLRVLRGMQFAARFGFEMDERTIELCKRVKPEFVTLSQERIFEEWRKWATKGRYPEKGLDVLLQTTWLECFPELFALVGIPQKSEYHPEGDLFEHVRQTCVAARLIADEFRLPERETTILLFAALLHDIGKPASLIEKKGGGISTKGHARLGKEVAEQFLLQMRAPLWLVRHVAVLARCHDWYIRWKGDDTTLRRLAEKLEPSNLVMWNYLASADLEGRCASGLPTAPRLHFSDWVERARELGVDQRAQKPLIQGRDLVARGLAPSPQFKTMLQDAWEAQLDGVFLDPDSADAWLSQYLQKRGRPNTRLG
ncbi:MAG: HD domain-containing protein [Planctomycetia bacterium]|nr:HD domain-containing protein [Planctomycetia bacterium]